MSNRMTIKFWKVGGADAITISFKGPDGTDRNLFIDGGYMGTYKSTIKKELLSIHAAKQFVDLWIITHTDRDHIGGIEAFLKDPSFMQKSELVKEYWFNWSNYKFNPLSENISVSQGIHLRDYLESIGKLRTTDIIANKIPIERHGLKLTILSPNYRTLNDSKVAWNVSESQKLIAGAVNDYGTTIDALLSQPFNEDDDVWNGGSIAFMMEYDGRKMLFLADSFPSVVLQTLKEMGYSSTNRLSVDFVKLSHHGSKRSYSPELLEIIDCSRFIILANGVTHSLPNKWTLAQILAKKRDNGNKIEFVFNDDTDKLRHIFSVDERIEQYNFKCSYSNSPFIKIDIPS